VSAAAPATVVCFGEALVDLLARAPASPATPPSFTAYAGGAPANVAVAVARLGGAARFVGMLGEDLFGELLAGELQRAGVDISCTRRTRQAKTALAFVALDEHGERSFSFYRPPAADLLFRAADFAPRAFAEAAVLHVCSNSLTEAPIAAATLAGVHAARAAGALISMDVNLRPSLWGAGVDPAPLVWQLLLEADLVKLDEAELDFLARSSGGAQAALARAFAARAQVVVVTAGAAPFRWLARGGAAGGGTTGGTVRTFAVSAVDSTAAGDAFVGGWLQALIAAGVRRDTLREWLAPPRQLEQTLRYAAACGALATTRHGAFAAMPAAAEVQALLGTGA
jgi:fructokinase